MTEGQSLFRFVDCVQFHVPDLSCGISYYCQGLGLRLIWKTDTAAGLGMTEGATELVLQTERPGQEIDMKVDAVPDAIQRILAAGGKVVAGPFDIAIGLCAVVEDPWGNRHVILDSSKGTFVTDAQGEILGHNTP